jgi:LuxR family transcriptional regulator, maltose regulon positive regulatory protein
VENRAPGSPAFPRWKAAPPQIPEHAFRRTNLVAEIEGWLDDPFGRVDTILVNAPPGYGKSTLLAQWAASTRFPALWYHLDDSDSDPATLIYGLIHVLRTYAPRRPWAVRDLLQHAPGGALTTSELQRAAEVFSKDIGAHIAKPLVLVLTGVDRLETQGEARSLLEHLLARPRDPLQLILEYRELEALKFSIPLVQGRIRSIGLDALQCTREELAHMLAARGINAEAAYLDDLQSLCDGWVAGVTLATGISLPDVRAARTTDEFNREAVFDYATREVLDRFPENLRDFAVRASVLDDVTAPLCRDLLGIDDAREQLVALTRITGMVSRFGSRPDEAVFRLQPLLREVLRERLVDALGADGVAALRIRAAGLLESVGDEHADEQAARLYALAGASDELIALIERNRSLLLHGGRGATLTRWIDLIEREQRRKHPELLVL